MSMRIVSAAAVLGVVVVGAALAAQDGGQPKEPAGERARLRAEIAKGRAEEELLRLEHEADADFLKKLMADMADLEALEAMKGPMKKEVKSLKDVGDERLAVPAGLKSQSLVGLKVSDEDVDQMFRADEVTTRLARPLLDRKKKEFVLKTTALNMKRLELADLEKQYDQSR